MLPVPPAGLTVAMGVEHTVTGIMLVLLAVAFVFAIWHWLKSGRPVVLLLLLAGGGMMVMEPLVDTVGGCWFAVNSEFGLHAYGRGVPIWVCLNYFDYFGIGGGLIWMAMQKGITRLQLQMIFVSLIFADTIMEIILLHYGPYLYYGHQPLVIANFPLWWGGVNALVAVAAAAIVYDLAPKLRGFALLLIIPAVLCVSAATNAAAGWPAWLVINTDLGPLLTACGGVASIVFAFGIVHWLGGFVTKTAKTVAPAGAGRLRAAE